MKREPVVAGNIVIAIVTLAAIFGLELEPEALAATIATVTAIVAFFQRSKVTPTD